MDFATYYGALQSSLVHCRQDCDSVAIPTHRFGVRDGVAVGPSSMGGLGRSHILRKSACKADADSVVSTHKHKNICYRSKYLSVFWLSWRSESRDRCLRRSQLSARNPRTAPARRTRPPSFEYLLVAEITGDPLDNVLLYTMRAAA